MNENFIELHQELIAIKQSIDSLTSLLSKPSKLAVDVKEAAEMIGVSKSTLYLLMVNKEIRYSSIGGKKVIKLKEIERLLTDREITIKRR